jgi:putative acetyltransferase
MSSTPPLAVEIREERPEDVAAIREVNSQAFGQELEGRIVDALRRGGAARLSLIAVVRGEVVGHILFSPLFVGDLEGATLGPMAVAPSFQRLGIGSRLVRAGLDQLGRVACPFVIVLGHPEFYPRFGFQPAAAHGVTCPWDVTPAAFMVAVLNPEVAGRLSGVARYRDEFTTTQATEAT